VTTAKWNASAPNQSVDQTTTLYAIATANGCPSEIASSSVTIKHKPVAPTVENIRECAAVTPEAREWASLVSNVEANAELKWYNGSAAVTPADFDMSVAMNKAYSVTQTVNGCESDKSMVEVYIKPLPEAPMVTNNVVCEGVGSKAWRDLVTSRVDGGVKTWFSDINGTAQIAEPITISFSKPGERTAYVAIEKDGCLSEIVEVSSSVHATPSFAEVIDESDESTTLRVNGVAPFTYLLDKNIREEFDGEVNLGILSIGNHPLTVSDEIGCKNDTVLRIEPIPLVPDKFFTPNGDGVNDKWTIKGLERYPETKIFLHDRYGKELAEFKAKDFDGWDGKYNGEDMPSTDYWYIIELRETGKRMVGHFLLRR
jgi:gliding motility-associated-like protein